MHTLVLTESLLRYVYIDSLIFLSLKTKSLSTGRLSIEDGESLYFSLHFTKTTKGQRSGRLHERGVLLDSFQHEAKHKQGKQFLGIRFRTSSGIWIAV